MNLGAPILDVSVITHSSTQTATEAAAQQSQSIVTGGVVSAPGYSPIVIYRVNSNSYTNGATSSFQGTTSAAQ